jgi:hypothetical protein
MSASAYKNTSYSAYHKKYYDGHKDEISAKTKEYWVEYYQRNKERIKARALERYHEKKRITNIQGPLDLPGIPEVASIPPAVGQN